jgi:2',3'-cyclic-nucleotide 2'-phosphodiesterase (5'-nucleotidase family)
MRPIVIFALLFCLPLFIVAQEKGVIAIEYGQIWMGEEIPKDSAMEALLLPYRVQMAAEMEQIIGFSGLEMKKGQPESLLGNFLSDLLLKASEQIFEEKVDLAVLNYGGIRRASLPAGNWTMGMLFELMPFENYVVLLSLKGSTLLEFLEFVAISGGWPVSSSLSMEWQMLTDTLLLHTVTIQGQLLDPDQTYTLATVDYVAQGGDRAGMLIDQPRMDSAQLLREVILREIQNMHKQGIPLQTTLGGRMIYRKDE